MLFDQYADMYLTLNRERWKPSYLNKVEGIISSRFSQFYGKDITTIKVTDCKLWYLSLKDVSPKSKSGYISVLRGIFDLAFYDDIIPRNPALHVKPEKHDTPRISPFTADEVQLILVKAKTINWNFHIFLSIGFYTGMRTGEIIALKWNEIDFENKTISINSTRSRFGEGSPKTRSSRRTLPIIDTLFPILKEHAKNRKLYRKSNPDGYVLVTQYGGPYRDTFVFQQRWWTPLLKSLGLEYRRPYTMRHTYATNMLYRNLVTPLQLAELLGHTSSEMVHNVYVCYLKEVNTKFDRSISVYS